jgi:hypothetical protein
VRSGPNRPRSRLPAERLQGHRATVDREASTVRTDVVLDVEVNTAL